MHTSLQWPRQVINQDLHPQKHPIPRPHGQLSDVCCSEVRRNWQRYKDIAQYLKWMAQSKRRRGLMALQWFYYFLWNSRLPQASIPAPHCVHRQCVRFPAYKTSYIIMNSCVNIVNKAHSPTFPRVITGRLYANKILWFPFSMTDPYEWGTRTW